jgi:hypothetical protein
VSSAPSSRSLLALHALVGAGELGHGGGRAKFETPCGGRRRQLGRGGELEALVLVGVGVGRGGGDWSTVAIARRWSRLEGAELGGGDRAALVAELGAGELGRHLHHT